MGSGPARPTLDTVAEAAGVSRMTVSNAYNRPDQLSAATREKVLAAAARLGYAGPDPAGRSLRRGRTGSVGVVITESLTYALNDPGLVSFLRGVADELSPSGRSMLLIPTDSDREAGIVRDAIVDGFITCALDSDDPAVGAVRSRGLPWATVGNPRLPGVPFLGIDNRAAAALAAEHLVGLGHRRLAVVGVPPRMPVAPSGNLVPSRPGFAQRVEGFVAAAAAHGIDPAAIAVVQAATNDTEAAAEAVAPVLAARGRPTGVFAVSDVLALGVLAGARRAGLDVPGDLSVVGFDGIEEGERSGPPLTTIAQDLREQGRLAARVVLGLLEGERRRIPRSVPSLLVRSSTARPRR